MVRLSFVLAPTQNRFFVELVGALRHELGSMGVDSTLSRDGFQPPQRGVVNVVLPPHEYFALEGNRLPPHPDALARTVFISAEQPLTPHFEDNVALAPRAGAVFDINSSAVAEYRRRGVQARHLQLGYSDYWNGRRTAERDIDVLFLGCASWRRSHLLASYADILGRLRCRLVLSDNSAPNHGPATNFVVGDEKLALLRRAKVLLNLHQGEEPYFEWLRAMEAIHSGCVLVSEHSSCHEPLVPSVHFASGRGEALGYLAEELVQQAGLRERIAADAYAFLRDELPLRAAVEQLVEVAGRVDSEAPAGPAGPVSLATAPPPPAPPDGGPEVIRPLVPYGDDPDMSVLRRVLKDIRLDMLDLRREATRASLTRAGVAPPVVTKAADSAAYRGRSVPRVSVLTALHNHQAHVVGALDSVARGSYADFELVVVDDGSTDGSLRAVERWAEEHQDVRLLLLQHPVNRGLPQARNTALDFARGDCSFILDADNQLQPHCLERLVAAMDAAPEAAVAYGMLACFDDEGYRHLISHFPWEPARLRRGNYIDAMALMRTRVVREMGGYTTDRRLHGWEDYDLYCRLAERGAVAEFVPEMVGRYRVSPTSMVSLSNVSVSSAYSALKERCPNLMRGVLTPP